MSDRLTSTTGLKPLSLGDVEAGTQNMQPIHGFLASDVVFASDRRTLDGLEPETRAALLAVVAGYLPYYTSKAQVDMSVGYACKSGGRRARLSLIFRNCRGCSKSWYRMSSAGKQGLSLAMESFPSPSHTLDEGGHRAGEAADYGALWAHHRTYLHVYCPSPALIGSCACRSRVAGDPRSAHAQRGEGLASLPQRAAGKRLCPPVDGTCSMNFRSPRTSQRERSSQHAFERVEGWCRPPHYCQEQS